MSEALFLLWLGVTAALWLLLLSVLVVTLLLPRAFIGRFFAAPHFRPAEIVFLSGFPFAYMRTFMFMRVVANPRSGRVRGLEHAHRAAPGWFRAFARVALPLFYALVAAFALLLAVLAAMATGS